MSFSKESVAICIFNKERDQVLLVKRRDVPVWVLPGGGIDEGESPQQAALRETHEETGYTVEITKKIAEYTPVNRLTFYTHLYECQILSGTAHTNDEICDIRFFSVDALPYYLPPPYPMWIHEALHYTALIKKPIEGVNYKTLLTFLFKHPVLVLRFLLSRIGLSINTK